MTVTFINCNVSGNSKDGINAGGQANGSGVSIGSGMDVRVIGGSTNSNGRNGITVDSNINLHVENHTSHGNMENGYLVIGPNLLSRFGLPTALNLDKFNELLNVLKNTAPENRENAVYSSFLAGTLALFADSSTIVMNILQYIEQLPLG